MFLFRVSHAEPRGLIAMIFWGQNRGVGLACHLHTIVYLLVVQWWLPLHNSTNQWEKGTYDSQCPYMTLTNRQTWQNGVALRNALASCPQVWNPLLSSMMVKLLLMDSLYVHDDFMSNSALVWPMSVLYRKRFPGLWHNVKLIAPHLLR